MTNSKKILLVSIVLLIIVTGIFAVACDKKDTDYIANTLEYATKCTTLKVEMSKDGELVYSYDNGVENDKYGLDIDVASIVGTKADKGLLLKKTDLKEGYKFNHDSAKQTAELTGEFANAKELLGIDADKVNLSIKADLKAKKVTEYKVTYTSAKGYDVVITLY